MHSALEFFSNTLHRLCCFAGWGSLRHQNMRCSCSAGDAARGDALAEEAQLKCCVTSSSRSLQHPERDLDADPRQREPHSEPDCHAPVRFLRYTHQDPMKKVTLRQEVEAMNLYLTTERLRFGERLRLEFAIEERALEALVPSLLLQPLIENAVKYAVSPSEQGGTIRVEGRARGVMLELAVADDGPGLNTGAAPGAGRGVARNIASAAVLYEDRHDSPRWTTSPGCVDLDFRWKGRTMTMNAPRKLRHCGRRGCRDAGCNCACAWRTTSKSSASAATAAGARSDSRTPPGPRVPRHPDLGSRGFDVLAELQPHELPMIVFVTAYDRSQYRHSSPCHRLRAEAGRPHGLPPLTHVRELTEQRTAVASATSW
jgi:hypothetical protein